ncbi:MAG: PRC-barrel domain-containing protein [Sphingomonas sp.]
MSIETRAPERLIASDRVEGTAVYNRDDERLGTVERFMVDKVSGQAEYAVLGFGGLFGLGHRHYPLPWKTLTYDVDKGGYVVDLSKEQLEGAPSYDDEEEPAYDSAFDARISGYYGIVV